MSEMVQEGKFRKGVKYIVCLEFCKPYKVIAMQVCKVFQTEAVNKSAVYRAYTR